MRKSRTNTRVMGILNVTPDSFADGGRHHAFEDALRRGREMMAEGADVIDVGGESTRPGAERVPEEVEQQRVLPVVRDLVQAGATVSVDTSRASVAREAVEMGAMYVNDVSGGLADEGMAGLVASSPQVRYVVMHWRGHSRDMQERALYDDVVEDVKDELGTRIRRLLEAGVDPAQLIVDPGLGFAKEAGHNWELLRRLDELQALGYPVLVGASRKSFLGKLTGEADPDRREAASIAVTTLAARAGVWGVRTHSVKPHKDAIAAVAAMAG